MPGTNAWNSRCLIVSCVVDLSLALSHENAAAYVPFNVFVSISSSDGYETMMSHLGPDKKVA